MSAADELAAVEIHITGVVQGVGFRPFVKRLAEELGIRGAVRNSAAGVFVWAEGAPGLLSEFVRRLQADAPPMAQIRELVTRAAFATGAECFEIVGSEGGIAPTAHISADLPVCDECLREMRATGDARRGYAYINCTNCGPRYSIVQRLPYDRPHTTMADWKMCVDCRSQYEDAGDRRFHAQPIACPRCGPEYVLEADAAVLARGSAAIEQVAARLRGGEVIGIKGLGGYHVACDARNAGAVAALRERKFRKEKPFAVMTASLAQARELVWLSATAEALLVSAARPIVLAKGRVELPGVAPGVDELGVMLPYTPLQHLLFDAGAPTPLVLTSANASSEPIAYTDADARLRLEAICDALLVGEREIARRVEDSVVTVRRGRPFMIRRGRGYAPLPVARVPGDEPILAVGADLKNAVALAVDGDVYISQHIGDLDEVATRAALRETIADLLAMYVIDPGRLVIAHDAHPQYVSTQVAAALPCCRRVAVQHHVAHVAAALAEHNAWDRRVVGIALDGTGYGNDGAIWGGEFLVGSVREGFERLAHLAYVSMPGGDAAARWPVQAAAAYLAQEAGLPDLAAAPFHFPKRFQDACELVRSGVRCFPTSSTGRMFDAAAALLGFTRPVTYEGQAAIWLEQLARRASGTAGPYDGPWLEPKALLVRIAQDRARGAAVELLARRFHDTLAEWIVQTAGPLVEASACDAAVLTGGVFQNALLLDRVAEGLAQFTEVLIGAAVPVNDGGICLGQAAMAAVAAGASESR